MKYIFYMLFMALSLQCFAVEIEFTDVEIHPTAATYSFFKRYHPDSPDKIYLTLSDGELSARKEVIGEGFRLSLMLTADMTDVKAESDSIILPTGEFKQDYEFSGGIMGSGVVFDYSKTIDGKLVTYKSDITFYPESKAGISIKKEADGYTIVGDKYIQIPYLGQGPLNIIHIIIPETKIQITQEFPWIPAIKEGTNIDFTKHDNPAQTTKVTGNYTRWSTGSTDFYPVMGNIELHIFDTPTFEKKYDEPCVTNGAGRAICLYLNTLYGVDNEYMDYDDLCGEFQPRDINREYWPKTFDIGGYSLTKEDLTYYPYRSFCAIYDKTGATINLTSIQVGYIYITREDDGEFSISGTVSESSDSEQRNQVVPFSFYWKGDLLSAIQGLPTPASIDNMNADVQSSNTTVISNLLGQQVNPAGAGFKIVKEGNRVVKKFVK